MLQLYYHPGNASLIPHILLEELGVPFELLLVDRANAAHRAPDYLKLNPNGQMLCRWTRGFARPGRGLPHLGPYLQRMLARPAVQRAFATEKLPPPLV